MSPEAERGRRNYVLQPISTTVVHRVLYTADISEAGQWFDDCIDANAAQGERDASHLAYSSAACKSDDKWGGAVG
ncbi:MAG: hypothetical protein BroJett021_21260 [Chloroflexota bacterium]|nr:MAG: hypothetical protein BroJett021_21260 [Chloroflexota bacterium]